MLGLSLEMSLWSGLSDFNASRAAGANRDQTALRLARESQARSSMIRDGQQQLKEDYARFQEAVRVWKLASDLRQAADKRNEAGMASFDDRLGP